MAEVALALAMAFFCIMVLTLVSMGPQMITQHRSSVQPVRPVRIVPHSEQAGPGRSLVDISQMVLFDGRDFFDGQLVQLDPADLSPTTDWVLAVLPDLAFSTVVAARDRIRAEAVTITDMSTDWIVRIKEVKQ